MPEEGSKVSMKSDGRNASHDQRNKRNSAPFPVPISALHLRQMGVLRVAYAVVTSALFGVAPTSAQPEAIRCLPPEAPMTELPADVLAEYRAEIAAEFEAYFADLSNHIACLDAERSRALSEARVATEAYSTFLNIPPAQKDLP